MKELKNLFSGIQDREQPLEERHLREIECLQSAQREEKSSKGSSSRAKRSFSVKLVSAAACAVAAVFACTFAFRGLFHKDNMETGNGSDSTHAPTNSASDDLRALLAEGYEQEALAAAVVSYMDRNARGEENGAVKPISAARKTVAAAYDADSMGREESYAQNGSDSDYGFGFDSSTAPPPGQDSGEDIFSELYHSGEYEKKPICYYPMKSIFLSRGIEFYVNTQADTFLTEKCGKGELRVIIAWMESETFSDQVLLCVVGERGSYFSVDENYDGVYFIFSEHKRIANGMLIKDLTSYPIGQTVIDFRSNEGMLYTYEWVADDGGKIVGEDSYCYEYAVMADSYRTADVVEQIRLSDYTEEYLLVRLTNAPIAVRRENAAGSGEILGYALPAVYGVYDKNGEYYEVPCEIRAEVSADWTDVSPDALSGGSLLKIYYSAMDSMYGNQQTIVIVTAEKLCLQS